MNLRLSRRSALMGAGGLAAASLAAPAYAQRAPIRLGGLATLEGPFATGGQATPPVAGAPTGAAAAR